jgi:hypothetical protein
MEQIYNWQRDLFDDLILNIKVSDLCKEVNQEDNKRNPESVRKNCLVISPMQNEVEDDWLTCGFINYAHIKRELWKFVSI